ncbi:hypothetical protein HJB90_08830 [Rhizobium sp. NLR10a]|nr:hypothetical protein [Rhizobium sp. NLR9a]MBX5218899.1 hypothetical protein [Rhizobium sp. NLR8a]MBX5275341.1 hypothetical protein [Rhizobium sp. NLR13a]MBX5281128.1 hypothetical protein [Rhizobium sp. NLR10a]MBX5295439.1 hypothetical protein [Rhizobium sp. NLR15a]
MVANLSTWRRSTSGTDGALSSHETISGTASMAAKLRVEAARAIVGTSPCPPPNVSIFGSVPSASSISPAANCAPAANPYPLTARRPSVDSAQPGGCATIRRVLNIAGDGEFVGRGADIFCGVVENEIFEMDEFAVDPEGGTGVGKVLALDPALTDRRAGDALVGERQFDISAKRRLHQGWSC